MDPEGNIYDMLGNFIGTAHANDFEEVDEEAGHGIDEQQLIN